MTRLIAAILGKKYGGWQLMGSTDIGLPHGDRVIIWA
jgi:hypothetical protein